VYRLVLAFALVCTIPFGVRAGNDPVEALYVVGNSKTIITKMLRASHLDSLSFPAYLQRYGSQFVGVRYGAGGRGCGEGLTLINVEEMDCVTFVENLLALCRASNELNAQYRRWDGLHFSDDHIFRLFVLNLNRVRYYGGVNCDWEDRIHYFTAGLRELQKMGWAADVGPTLGEPISKPINYITAHRKAYPGIEDWPRVEALEQQLSTTTSWYYPYSEIERYEAVAQTGDIIAFCTDVAGLDVSHCGFVEVDASGRLSLTHASSVQHVVVRGMDFCDYMGRRTSVTGIMVYRPTF
jgi:cell wall-associated NlpC family hydrolase